MATESNSKFHQSAIPGNSDPHDPAKMMLCASKFEGRLCTKGILLFSIFLFDSVINSCIFLFVPVGNETTPLDH